MNLLYSPYNFPKYRSQSSVTRLTTLTKELSIHKVLLTFTIMDQEYFGISTSLSFSCSFMKIGYYSQTHFIERLMHVINESILILLKCRYPKCEIKIPMYTEPSKTFLICPSSTLASLKFLKNYYGYPNISYTICM